MRYYQVDAFTDKPFLGNPAAVFIVEDFPKTTLCQEIATHLNLSQTAFVKCLKQNHFHIRWFSPKDEAPICGHATLASAHVLWQENIVTNSVIQFDSLAGELIVQKEADNMTMFFPKKPINDFLYPPLLLEALNISKEDIVDSLKDDTIFVIRLKNEDLVSSLTPNLKILSQLPCRAVCVTSKADDEKPYDFVSRYFAPRVGIHEDPVCGSAHCRLTPYWEKTLSKKKLIAKQLSKRTGILDVQENEDGQILLTSKACIVSKGVLLLKNNAPQ